MEVPAGNNQVVVGNAMNKTLLALIAVFITALVFIPNLQQRIRGIIKTEKNLLKKSKNLFLKKEKDM